VQNATDVAFGRVDMKTIVTVTAFVVLSAIAGASQGAPPATASKVAMIDISRAVLLTSEGKDALAELDKKFEPRKADIQRQSTELQGLQKQLQEGSKLPDDERSKLVKSIQDKRLALQHAAEDAQSEYRQAQNEIIGRVLKKLAPVIDKYARDNQYTMIFDAQFWPSGPVLWASGPAADITSAIIAAYNAQPAQPTPSGDGSQ